MTDAEIVAWFREGAASSSRGLAQAQSAAEIREVSQGAYRDTRAADAIEENARLRALLGEASDYVDALTGDPTPGDAASHAEARDLLAKITAALRKPDAAGGAHE